jgi:hypothetical protein
VNIARKKSTGDLIDVLTEAKDMARFVKICQGHDSKTLGVSQRPDGSDTTTVEKTLAHLMQVYFPWSVRTEDILEVSTMPRDWLISNYFFPKPGKERYNIAKSFSPISLSPFILKGLERIVGLYLEKTVMRTNPLSKWQHRFRKEESTKLQSQRWYIL